MLRSDQLEPDRALLLVIDMQAKLLPLIDDREAVIQAAAKLLGGAGIFKVPVVATEQYPKGLGRTVEPLAAQLADLNAAVIEKPTFSACGHDPVRNALTDVDRPQIIIAGIEAHICVLQTSLDLVTLGYDTFVCADAVGSRNRLDYNVALDRMRHAGATVCTTESVLFELCGRCDTGDFKEMLKIIKD